MNEFLSSDQLDEGELAGPVYRYVKIELALGGAHFGDVDVELPNRVRYQGPGGNKRAIRADLGTIRASVDPDHRQPAVRRVEPGLSRSAMTLATVDRLVQHATIFEMNVEKSYRRRIALEEKRQRGRPASLAAIRTSTLSVAERQSKNDE